MKFEVYDFEGTGGVALAMYNTDKVQIVEIDNAFGITRPIVHFQGQIRGLVNKTMNDLDQL